MNFFTAGRQHFWSAPTS